MSDFELTTTDVARLLDVHPSTTKRWCDEGALASHRTQGGHRRIRLQDVLELAASRSIPTSLRPFGASAPEAWSAVRHAERRNFKAFVSVALDHFLPNHPHALGALVELVLTHPQADPPAVLDHGIAALMTEVGKRWSDGRLIVADERFVTESVTEAILRATPSARTALPPSRSAAVASPELGKHHMGALCVLHELRRWGWDVFYLGAGVPVLDVADMQRRRGCALVCLSFSRPARGSDVRRAVQTLATSFDPASPYALAVGGEPTMDAPLAAAPNPFTRLGQFEGVTDFSAWLNGSSAPS